MTMTSKLFYLISLALTGLLFLADFRYIGGIKFSFMDDSLGPLVFLVSAYIVWLDWDRLKQARIAPKAAGLIGVIASILLYFAAVRAELPQAYHVSFIVFLISSVYYIFGSEITEILAFPIAYTFFVIPINFLKEMIGVPLRFFVSAVSAGIFNVLGMPAERVGTSIYLGFFSFDIAAPCSGINSLFSLLALSAVFAYLTEKSNLKRAILFVSAIPIAVVVNILRVTSIGLVAKSVSKDIALSVYHDYSGYILFILSLALLYLEKMALDAIGHKKTI